MDKHQLAEFIGAVATAVPRDIPSAYAQYLMGPNGNLRKILGDALLAPRLRVKIPALARDRNSPRKWPKFNPPWSLVIQDQSPECELVMKLHFARRGETEHRFLGLQHALWLAENQHQIPLILPDLEIQFPGTTVGDPNNSPYMPVLLSEPPSQRSYDQGRSWKVDWISAENFGRGEGYVAIAE